jgi:quercetin dioxygenase-like cupin family protein
MSLLYLAQADEHQRFEWLGGLVMSVLLDGKATSGQLAMLRSRPAIGHAAPVHLHENEDEIFLMLAGQAIFWFGGERHELGEGGVIFLPRNVPHAYRVLSAGADMLVICTPGGFEDLVRATGHDLAKLKPDSWSALELITALAAGYGQRILGPAPAG